MRKNNNIKTAQRLAYRTQEKLYFLDAVLTHSKDAEELHNADVIGTLAGFIGDIHDEVMDINDTLVNLVEDEKYNRLPRLERFMESLADQMEEEPENWNFKATAENIRELLAR